MLIIVVAKIFLVKEMLLVVENVAFCLNSIHFACQCPAILLCCLSFLLVLKFPVFVYSTNVLVNEIEDKCFIVLKFFGAL